MKDEGKNKIDENVKNKKGDSKNRKNDILSNNNNEKIDNVDLKKEEVLKKKNNEEEKGENSKNKKTNFSKYTFSFLEVILIMLVTIVFGLILGSFATYLRLDDGKKTNCYGIRKDMTEFASVYDDLINEYYSDIDKDELLKAAIKGMVDSLGDPYSSFIDKDEALAFDEELNGSFVGMGVEIVSIEGSLPIINKVYDDSPASKANIMVGDIITKVDGKDINGLSPTEVGSLIKVGNRGDKFTITVLRDDESIDIELTKDVIELKSVSSEILNEDFGRVGWISISTFANNTYTQFKKEYESLKEAGVTSLVIDLRDNGGGYLSIAKDISSMFLDENDIIYKKDTKDGIREFISENKKEINMPLVLIVNSNTASAAEVMTATLKENLGVMVVGVKTYGKGAIQKLHHLSDGSYVRYTTQKWLTPSGNTIEGVGIEPTVKVTLSESYNKNPSLENDTQLLKALELLKSEGK